VTITASVTVGTTTPIRIIRRRTAVVDGRELAAATARKSTTKAAAATAAACLRSAEKLLTPTVLSSHREAGSVAKHISRASTKKAAHKDRFSLLRQAPGARQIVIVHRAIPTLRSITFMFVYSIRAFRR